MKQHYYLLAFDMTLKKLEKQNKIKIQMLFRRYLHKVSSNNKTMIIIIKAQNSGIFIFVFASQRYTLKINLSVSTLFFDQKPNDKIVGLCAVVTQQ
jgi:hypothetical protein